MRRKRRNGGFTLLEILIALGVIAVALIAVFQLQAQNLDLQAEARFMTLAKCLIQDRLTQITCRETLSEGTATGKVGDDFPDFSYQEEISRMPEVENLYKVKLGIMLQGEKTHKDLWIETYIYKEAG